MVDAEVDVRDGEQVWAAIAHEAHLVRDVWRHAAPPDPLDPTSTWDELGRRWQSTPRGNSAPRAAQSRPRKPPWTAKSKSSSPTVGPSTAWDRRRSLNRYATTTFIPCSSINPPPACARCSAKLPDGMIC